MGTALSELNKCIKNITNIIFMRKMKGITVLNSLEALGIVQVADDEDNAAHEGRITALWGRIPSTRQTPPTESLQQRLRKKPSSYWWKGRPGKITRKPKAKS